MNLGERIYAYRTAKNMSQGDLADALDVSRQSVSKWENNTAVPELEKIVKMAQLFEVSLDALITGTEPEPEAPELPPQAAPAERIVYVEKPVFPPFPAAKVLGAVLLVISIVLLVLLVAAYECEILQSILLLLPVMAVGTVCLAAKQPVLWSLWCGVGGYWLYFFILARRWEEGWFFIIFGIVLVILMLIWTVRKQDKGEIHIPFWVWIVGLLVLTAGGCLLVLNLLPPESARTSPVIPIAPD